MVRVKANKTYTLDLTESEARLLKAWVQNPLSDSEGPETSKWREKLFNALRDVLGDY